MHFEDIKLKCFSNKADKSRDVFWDLKTDILTWLINSRNEHIIYSWHVSLLYEIKNDIFSKIWSSWKKIWTLTVLKASSSTQKLQAAL